MGCASGCFHAVIWKTAAFSHDPRDFEKYGLKEVLGHCAAGCVHIATVNASASAGNGLFVPVGWSCAMWAPRDNGDAVVMAWPHVSKTCFDKLTPAQRAFHITDLKKMVGVMSASPLGKAYAQYFELLALLEGNAASSQDLVT